MLTFLGVISMMGSAWLGFTASAIEIKGGGWWGTGVYFVFISGLVACLALAFLCFGGKF